MNARQLIPSSIAACNSGFTMASLRIILLSIAAAIVYGVIHDQVTVRVCLEYFTVGHPRIIASEDPTILGLVWGVVATWWAGLIMGVPLALAARVGSWPKFEASALVSGIVVLLLVMAICAASAGVSASRTDGADLAREAPELAAEIPPERHHLFIANWAAHATSYMAGCFGGIALTIVTVVRRWRLEGKARARQEPRPTLHDGN